MAVRQSICRHATLQFGGTAVFGEFDREDIYRYRPATAQCQRSLGKLYEVHLKNYPKAEQCYRKSIEILQELCENEYERCNFIRSIQHSQLHLAHLHSDTSSEQDRPAN